MDLDLRRMDLDLGRMDLALDLTLDLALDLDLDLRPQLLSLEFKRELLHGDRRILPSPSSQA